jgi:hypothetical protein
MSALDLPVSMFDRPRELMQDKLLDLLKAQWVTPIDALNKAQCLSLSQRAGQFAREGHKVEKQWVHLPSGKKVMSYRVAT